MTLAEIDGIKIDYGPRGVSQAAPDASPPPGEAKDAVQPSATPDDKPAAPQGDPTPSGDGKGDGTPPNADPNEPEGGLYRPETVAAKEAAAEERGRLAALKEIQDQNRDTQRVNVKDAANESYRQHTAAFRAELTEAGITDPQLVTKIMAPFDSHNRTIADKAFDVGLELAGGEYADSFTARITKDLGPEKAAEFWSKGGGSPAELADRYINMMGLKSEAFVNGDPAVILAEHKGLNAFVQAQIDEGIDAYKLANRPATQPVNNQEATPSGPMGLASYKDKLKGDGPLPSAKEIDAMTAEYVKSIS